MKTNENGRSMIEMLGVLAIIGVLSVGGIAGYSKAMNKYKTNKVVDQVSMIVTNIRTLYAMQNTYSGLDNKSAILMGVIPDEMLVVDTSGTGNTVKYKTDELRNAFNGNVYIGYGSTGDDSNGVGGKTDTRAFYIEYDGLPRNTCVSIATGDWGSGSSSGLIGIGVSGASQHSGGTEGASADDIFSKIIPNAVAADGESGTGTDTTGSSDDPTKDNLTIGCTGTTASGSGPTYACPGGSVQPVPLNVAQAATACSCDGNTCSILWKYY